MLANEGGTAAAAVEMIPGGWIRGMRGPGSCLEHIASGWLQIQGLNRSPVTGGIVSVKVLGYYQAYGVETRKQIVTCNIERLAESDYRAPTPEELEEFTAATNAEKKQRKATAPKAISIINPTLEDAQALQTILNAEAAEQHAKHRNFCSSFEPKEVRQITQEVYSLNSSGDHARCATRTLHAGASCPAENAIYGKTSSINRNDCSGHVQRPDQNK